MAASANDTALREQVRGLVQRASERMDQGDGKSAAAILEQARRLRPDASLDYNLGITYASIGQGPESAQAFERFLQAADPGRVLPERLTDARKRLADYQQSLCRLRVRVALPPTSTAAAIYFDEQPAAMPLPGGSLPAPVWLQPGSHRLLVTAPGLRDYRVTIELGAGELREVTAELYADEGSAGLLRDPSAQVKKEPQPLYKKWWFWTAVGGGAATAVALIAAAAAGAWNHVAPGSDLDTVDLAR
jgi:hypothetical protein